MTQAVFGTGAGARTVNCVYDGFNRLKKVSDSNGETVYTYDADGLRSSSNESQYIWDEGQLVATIGNATIGGILISDFTLPEDGCKTVQMPALASGVRYYAVINGTTRSAVAKYVKGEPMVPYVTITGEEKPEIPPVAPYDRIVLDFGSVSMEMDCSESESSLADVYVVGFKNAHVKLYDGAPTGGSSGAKDTVYIRGLGLIASRTDNVPTYYHYDAHGSVVQTTDASGNVIHDYTYDAFGVEQNADPADTNPFRYCGEQYDTETGNYYLRARYYAPGTGRFTQEDPVRDGMNWYAYCAGNPVGFVDLLGLAPITYDVRFREIYDGSVDPGSLFGTDYTPTDAFVLYDSSAFSWTNLSSQADLIAEGLLNADSSINRVLKFDTANWSTSDIEEWWNALPSEGVPAVVIHGHGWPDGLQMRTSGKRTGITLDRLNGRRADGDNLNLTMKGIKNLVLFSCNNAHQDRTTNIAYTLAKDYLSPGSHVIGTDGTMFNVIFGYASITSDSAFYRYVSSGSTRTAAGFIKYTVLQDNTVAKTVLGHYSDWIGGLKGITSWLVGGKK